MIRKNSLLTIAFFAMFSSFAQSLSEESIKALKNSTYLISLANDPDNSNWNFIDKVIGEKKIVLIGEFTHGSKEVFEFRNALIKHLHESQGFNTIFFESGIGEMAQLDLNMAQYSPEELTRGFFGIWSTREFAELMSYIKDSEISIAGYDVQRSGRTFNTLWQNVTKAENLDTTYLNLESEFNSVDRKVTARNVVYDSVVDETNSLITKYQAALDILSDSKNKESKELQLVMMTLRNRIRYLQYRLQFAKDNDWRQRWTARDLAMKNNVMWLMENVFPGEKIIIVGHNFHIARYNRKEEVMGEFLKKKYGEEMYSIGSFGAFGEYADNSGQPRKMDPPDSSRLDIKHIIDYLHGFANFLSIPEKVTTPLDWLESEIVVNNSFIDLNGSDQMILKNQFDGLILIKGVSLPEKLH